MRHCRCGKGVRPTGRWSGVLAPHGAEVQLGQPCWPGKLVCARAGLTDRPCGLLCSLCAGRAGICTCNRIFDGVGWWRLLLCLCTCLCGGICLGGLSRLLLWLRCPLLCGRLSL